MKRALIIALVLFAGAPATARAGGADPDTLRLPLWDCIRMGLSRGEEMKIADANLATARAGYIQARATALPRLSFATTYTHQFESIFTQDGGLEVESFSADTLAPIADRVHDLEDALPYSGFYALGSLFSESSFGSEHTWVASLGITQKIFQGGSIWRSISAARHAMRGAENARLDARDDVILRIREAYLGALLAERGLRIAALALEQAESQLGRVRLRQEAGNASEFELLQAEVQRDNQIPQVKRARQIREVADLDLRRLINVPEGRPIALTTPLFDDAAVPAAPMAVDTAGLVEQALRAPAIVAAEEIVAARSAGVSVAASDRWPALSLFANYSKQAFPRDVLPKSGDWKDDINAGVRVDWSLFDGFLTKGAIQQSKAQRSIASQNLTQAREGMRLLVVQNRLDLERSAADLTARARTVQLARRAYDLANIRYEEGASDLLEVADARIAYQMAQTNEAQARHDYFVALARLERLTGRPLFSTVTPGGAAAGGGRE
jgi:outer membrane protein TolC